MAALTVYLSASPADAAFVARLRQAIADNGGKVVSPAPPRDTAGAADASDAPQLKTLDGARAYVAVLSPAAASSARIRGEAERYAAQAGQQGDRARTVVPVQLTPPAPESAIPALASYAPVTGPYDSAGLQDQLIAETLRRLGLPAERSHFLPLLLVAALLALLLLACLGLQVLAPVGGLHFFVAVPSSTSTPAPTAPPTATAAPAGTGLAAQYFRARTYNCCVPVADDVFGQQLFSRVDPQIDFRLSAGQYPDPRLAGGAYGVRWTGQIVPRYSETYTIITHSDDAIRVWINGKLVINRWDTHDELTDQATIQMTANQRYDIRIDYYENGIGDAVMTLQWQSPSQPLEVVPTSQLYPAPQQ